ncbi:MAG: GNAT family N-acetyltransferase [Acidobacteria bacterium]|nr:GNAT family N-acetyltransferase [Acidobacteriota bacterium]MBI3487475.1 GNAT family N-acetyltransferase [Acidobacteriota bacterium]
MAPVSLSATSLLRPIPEDWVIRPRRPEDIPGVIALMKRVYAEPHGPEAVWPQETLMRHLEVFPEGQLSVLDGQGRLIADSTAMVVRSGKALEPHRWSEITARGTLASHDPQGDAFYGVDLAVDPEFQGMGLAHHLYAARIALAMSLGCRLFVAGARMPGYHLASDLLPPQSYLALVERGLIYDPTLSKQLRLGFRLRGLLPGYVSDPESADNAALISMEL